MGTLIYVALFCLLVGAAGGVLVIALAVGAANADDAMDLWDLDEEDLP